MSLGYHRPALSTSMAAAITLMVAASCPALAAPKPRSVVYQQRHVYGVTAHVVTVNLNDPHIRVTVNLSQGGIGSSETMKSMVSRLKPVAAITGTFFDTRTLLPVGDIVARGKKVYAGPAGTGFAVLPDNTVDFRRRTYGRTLDWSDYRTVLCTGPTLLSRGRNALYPRAEGYRDPSLWALRPRTAVGVTKHNKMLLVAVNKPIHLSQMRSVMKSLGAIDALGLDGGSSSALYAQGRSIVTPGRRLTNVLAVYRVEDPSPHVAQRLAGKKVRTAARAATQKVRKSMAAVKKSMVVTTKPAPRPVPEPTPHPYGVALKTSLVVASKAGE